MTERFEQAVGLGVRVGRYLAAAVLLPFLPVLAYTVLFARERLAYTALLAVAAPAMTFAFYFLIFFGLAVAFPPEEGRFPGARKVIWPLVVLMVAATILFLSKSPRL